MRWLLRIVLVCACIAPCVSARFGNAQGILNPGGEPGYGQQMLGQAFAPDPLTVPVTSGGMVSVAVALGSACRGDAQGYVASAPDFRVVYAGEQTGRLRFFFVGAGDTTMVVSGPDSTWYCDDDSGGSQHPMITFEAPARGSYHIWVGSFSRGDFVNGALVVTGSDRRPGEFLAGDQGGGETVGLPQAVDTYDLTRDPVGGTAFLMGGFAPDPHTVALRSGGRMSLARNFADRCLGEAAGYSTSAASYRVYLESPLATQNLRVFFVSEADTTLAINAPDGRWYCNDDVTENENLNPAVTFEPAQAGWYNIWVGSFNIDEYASGTLYVTTVEREVSDFVTAAPGQGGGPTGQLDPHALPNFSIANLVAGFAPDPHMVRMGTGGDLAVADLLPGDARCAGYVSSAPDYRIKYTAAGIQRFLRFFFVGNGDTTLVILDPNESWTCDDDSGGWPHPMITVANPLSGYYSIWVGSFSRRDYISGSLYVTAQDIIPASVE